MKYLATVALVLGLGAVASAEDQASPEELLRAYLNATGTSDFAHVVNDVHPSVLESFKAHTQNIVEAAVEDFSEDAVISAFQGLETLEYLKAIPESDYWVYVMSNVYSPIPAFDGAATIKILGKVEDDNFLHILYTRNGDLKSTNEFENIRKPIVFTLRRQKDRWLYWSFEISAVETYVRQSAKRRHSQSRNAGSEQAGDGQARSRVESVDDRRSDP